MIEQQTFPPIAFANRMREPNRRGHIRHEGNQARSPHDIGPIGTMVRFALGTFLVGIIVYGQLMTSGHLSPITWVFGLIVFPALVLAWHFWRIRGRRAPLHDTSVVSFVLSIALPLAFYVTGLYISALWFTSDATLIFIGSSLLLAALRGHAGCEFLALSNWLLRRSDQMACAIFTPIDSLERPRSGT